MQIERQFVEKGVSRTRSVDAALVGLWRSGPSVVRILSNGWYYLLGGPYPFTISPDGQTLLFPASGTAYSRTSGSGPNLIGTWQLTEVDGADIWVEDIYYRANGTYTSQWTLNGSFDSEFLGSYSVGGGELSTEELRSAVETLPPNLIMVDTLYGTDQSGTYSVAGDQWTFHNPSGDVIYVRESQ